MSNETRLYKCPVCDTVVEILDRCGLELTCCGPEMVPLTEKVSAPTQPHAIMVEKWEGTVKVRIGNVPHPMEEDHHISWIELVSDGQCCRHFLRPGDEPEATFTVDGSQFVVRAYCSAHGLWRSSESPVASSRRLEEAHAAV